MSFIVCIWLHQEEAFGLDRWLQSLSLEILLPGSSSGRCTALCRFFRGKQPLFTLICPWNRPNSTSCCVISQFRIPGAEARVRQYENDGPGLVTVRLWLSSHNTRQLSWQGGRLQAQATKDEPCSLGKITWSDAQPQSTQGQYALHYRSEREPTQYISASWRSGPHFHAS